MFNEEEDNDNYFEGNLKEDLERFESFLKNCKIEFLDSDRLVTLIDHYLITSQYSKAKKCAEHALVYFSFNTNLQLKLAQSMGAMGQLKEALGVLSKIEKTEVATFEVILTKASIFSQLRDSKNAIKYFRESLSLCEPEDKDEIYLDLAMEHENLKDYNGALEVLKEAIKYNPKNEGAIYEIAFCYDQLKDYEKAIQCYSDFIDDNPYSFTAWYNLGNAYSKSESFEKAIWAYDYSVLINDDFGPVYFNLVNAYLSLEKYQLSIDSFNKCMELDGEDPIALCYVGEAHEQLGELELAKEFYKQSLELSPMLPDAWLGLGIVEDLQGRTREALTFILKANELDPENAGIYSVLAGAYEKLEEFDLAIDSYKVALTKDEKDNDCLTSCINLLNKHSLLESLAFLDLNFIHLHDSIAPVLKVNILWKLGRKQEAIHLFSKCVVNNKEISKELFDLYPELKEETALNQIIED